MTIIENNEKQLKENGGILPTIIYKYVRNSNKILTYLHADKLMATLVNSYRRITIYFLYFNIN